MENQSGSIEKAALNAFQQKQQDRRNGLLARAEQLRDEGQARWDAAGEMHSHTPGQPVLVGHHSEGRHRRMLAQSARGMDKAVEAWHAAEECEARAAAVGQGGISADDPEALGKLRAQLDAAEAEQERMKAINKAARQKDAAAALARLGIEQGEIPALLCNKIGKPGLMPYKTTNNAANIRRLKARIAELETHTTRQDLEAVGPGYVYRQDTAENRVSFEFSGKPNDQTRTDLKAWGFHWAPTQGVWLRQWTTNAEIAAASLRARFDAASSQ